MKPYYANRKKDRMIIVFGLLTLVSFIASIVCGIKGYYGSFYSYEEESFNALLTLGSFFCFILSLITLAIISSKSTKAENIQWKSQAFGDNNIRDEDIKSAFRSTFIGTISNELLYTDDRRLFYFENGYSNTNNNKSEEIKLEDILNIDLECTISEKNRKRIVALTTTYDNIKSITDVKIKIITEEKIYTINLDKTKESIEKATQFKLTLERELKALDYWYVKA